jgi:hypothetical protein
MDNNVKAVQNQKVFITLASVLDLQDDLRKSQTDYAEKRVKWMALDAGTPAKAAAMHEVERASVHMNTYQTVFNTLALPYNRIR